MIVHESAPVQTEARHDTTEAAETIRRLQGLLAEAIRIRDHVIAANVDLYERSRHWFVPDVTGTYCRACNLPRSNTARHCERPK